MFRMFSWISKLNLLRAFIIAIVFQVFLHLRDVYDFRKTFSSGQFIIHLGQALTLASGALSIIFYVVPGLFVGRGILAIALSLDISFSYYLAYPSPPLFRDAHTALQRSGYGYRQVGTGAGQRDSAAS